MRAGTGGEGGRVHRWTVSRKTTDPESGLAVITVVIGEAAFAASPALWALPLAVLGVLVVTAGVIVATMRTIGPDN